MEQNLFKTICLSFIFLGIVCAGFEITIKDLVHKIVILTDFKGEIHQDSFHPDDQPRRCLDTGRAKAPLGFEANTNFEGGPKITVDWFVDYQQRTTNN